MADDVRERFKKALAKDQKLKRLLAKEKPTYLDVDSYAVRVGELLGDTLTDEELEQLRELMIDDHENVANYTQDVQTSLNHEAGLNMQALSLPINQDRLDGLIKFAETIDEINSELKESIINFNQDIVTNSIEKNAGFQYESGLKPKIVRRFFGGCDWCREVAGSYRYPDVPHDVYRRHKRCRCTVNYYPGDGKRQDVWSKKWKDQHGDEIKERISQSEQPLSIKPKAKKSQLIIEEAIKNGIIKDEINRNKQMPHLEDSVKDNKSYLYKDLDNAKRIYNKYKGTGVPLLDEDGNWLKKERVLSDQNEGVCISKSGKEETNALMIVYSKTGSHLYPRRKGENHESH